MGNLFKTLLNEKVISIKFDDKSDLKNSLSQSVPANTSVEKPKKWAQKTDPETMGADDPISSDEKIKRQIIFSRVRSDETGNGEDLLKNPLASKSAATEHPSLTAATSPRKLGNITKINQNAWVRNQQEWIIFVS